MTEPVARTLRRAGDWPGPAWDLVVLGGEERFLRRRRLVTVHGEPVMVDLALVTGLGHGDALELADGRLVEIIAGEEPLAEVTATGETLARIAWHVGNRHTPCQIEAGRLLIRRDHVIEAMLARLGATLRPVSEPFTPEGGAYGTGRVMGHSHGPAPAHAHGHGHDHGQDHAHGPDNAHEHAHGQDNAHEHEHEHTHGPALDHTQDHGQAQDHSHAHPHTHDPPPRPAEAGPAGMADRRDG